MGKFRDNIGTFLPLLILLTIGTPLVIKEFREMKEEEAESKRQREIEESIECFRQPMTKNSSSLLIGYQLKGAEAYGGEPIIYTIDYHSKGLGINIFDSLFVEICKHHCDSIPSYTFSNNHNREFVCGNAGQTLTLTYSSWDYDDSSTISIEYGIPQIQGFDEEWEQYIRNGKYKTE